MIKAISNLFKNVFDWKIVQFLSIPVIFGALISLIPNGITVEWKIIIFGLVVFPWALAFPSLKGCLSKDAADFWYYTFAGIGVIFFFLLTLKSMNELGSVTNIVQ